MSEEESSTTEAPEPIGRGTRIRVVDGEAEGMEGEIFWWGRSKWGHGMRAGVEVDGSGDKIWIDAKELRAIDEDGNEFDPQPPLSAPVRRTEIEVRGIEVPYGLGRAITSWRMRRGLPKTKASAGPIRLDQLKAVEQSLDTRIPDAVIAFVVSGVGSTRWILDIERYTVALLEQLGRSRDDAATHDVIAFGQDGDKFLVYPRGAEQEFEGYSLADAAGNVVDAGTLEDRLTEELGADLKRVVDPFEAVVDYFTTDEDAEEPEEQWVSHKKFGRGIVLAKEPTPRGAKLTINFDDGETRKLLESFITYE